MAKEAGKQRIERKPIHARSVLEAESRDGYFRRYVVDVPGRIRMFLDGGYGFVKHDNTSSDTGQVQDPSVMDSSCVRRVANKGLSEEDGRYAYLMEIPLEWWQEDQEAKAQKANQIESTTLSNDLTGRRGRLS